MRSVSLWLVHIQHGMSASPVVFSASVHMFWAPQDLPFSVPMLSATCPCGLRGSKGRCSCQGKREIKVVARSGASGRQHIVSHSHLQTSNTPKTVRPFHLQLHLKMHGKIIFYKILTLSLDLWGSFLSQSRSPAIPLPGVLFCRLKLRR